MAAAETPGATWSGAVDAADWIVERLVVAPRGEWGFIIPSGFEAYCRLLHPGYADEMGETRVRWSQVAAWSGRELMPESEFHSIAFPTGTPDVAAPWEQGPLEGAMDRDDLVSLVSVLRRHTGTPDACWFCVWDGYGWGSVVLSRPTGDSTSKASATRIPDPLSGAIRNGPRVVTPIREYFLFEGPIEATLGFGDFTGGTHEGPNLMWPTDRAWCVATDLDLNSTYVGGSVALISELVASSELEALPGNVSNSISHVEPWVEALAHDATEALIQDGLARIDTYWGAIEVAIEASSRWRPTLFLSRRSVNDESESHWSSRTLLGRGEIHDFRETIEFYLADDVSGLAG